MAAPKPGAGISVPTQVAHPWRSILRTIVASLVGVILAYVIRTFGLDLTSWDQAIIDSVTAGAWTLGTGVAQWLLTRPWLQRALRAIGLGTGVHKEPVDVDDVVLEVDLPWAPEQVEHDDTPPPDDWVPRHRAG